MQLQEYITIFTEMYHSHPCNVFHSLSWCFAKQCCAAQQDVDCVTLTQQVLMRSQKMIVAVTWFSIKNMLMKEEKTPSFRTEVDKHRWLRSTFERLNIPMRCGACGEGHICTYNLWYPVGMPCGIHHHVTHSTSMYGLGECCPPIHWQSCRLCIAR